MGAGALPGPGGPAAPAVDVADVGGGEPAADFTLPLVGGGEASLGDYAGKVLVIDFWATWCGACVAELPDYQEMYDAWDHDRVEYLAVSLDTDLGVIDAWLEGRPELSLPMALGTEEMLDAYLGGRRTIPAQRVIGPEGTIVAEFGPQAEPADIAAAVDALLEDGAEQDG